MLNKKHILIVDDEDEIREIIKEHLEDEFKDRLLIQEAQNGHDALTKVRRQRFDLVITDVKMPKIDGLTLVHSTINLDPAFKPRRFLVISGHGTPAPFSDKIGRVSFMPKPISWPTFLTTVKTALEAETTAPKPVPEKERTNKHIDVAFITPFIDSTLYVLSVAAGIHAEKESVFIQNAEHENLGDISAIVGINSQKYIGSMALSFDQDCFLHVVSNMLGEPYQEINDENANACGEICNQIFGHAKHRLNQNGHTIQMAIPTVIVGSQHKIKHSARGPCVVISFKTSMGRFRVEAVTEARAPES
jgi:chemotaxis protein CheX